MRKRKVKLRFQKKYMKEPGIIKRKEVHQDTL